MTDENPPYDALDEVNRLFAIAVTCEAEELLKRLKPEWEPGQPLNDDRAARDFLVLAIATVLRRNPTNQHAVVSCHITQYPCYSAEHELYKSGIRTQALARSADQRPLSTVV